MVEGGEGRGCTWFSAFLLSSAVGGLLEISQEEQRSSFRVPFYSIEVV